MRDVGKAAKDWPQLNFIIYHGGLSLRRRRQAPATRWPQFEQTGRIEWVTDLAEIPAKYGVTNVYARPRASSSRSTTVAEPRLPRP